MSKPSKHVVVRNPEVIKALKQFMPVFANEEDRRLVAKIASHDKVLKTVNCEVLRAGKNLTPKMKEILKEEERLVEWITRRNMDF